ncbi:carbohydrate ABC transporter permease [Gracilibacillus sp. D59]|uniref:carbohydrate ABC transporter permease n=1 Tax=Gracilibacillus sp. D59 TaxID=3457434 RepID=UPI003FCDC5D9
MKLISYRKSEAIAAYSFILPAFILLLIFILNPMFQSLITSFYDVNLISDDKSLVGTANYTNLLSDMDFYSSLGHSFYFGLLVLPIQTAVALGLALLVKKHFRGVGIFRMIYFVPFVISMSVASSIFKMIYNKDSGLMNAILSGFGFPSLDFLSNPSIAMLGVALLGTWKSMGFFMIVFLAGLNNIPDDLYESAQIDGAGPIRRFISITLPLLKKVMTFVVIITTMDALKIFIPVYVMMEGGGPAGSTRTAAYFIYNTAFQKMDMGYASASAFIFFIIILIISLIQLRVLRSDVEY